MERNSRREVTMKKLTDTLYLTDDYQIIDISEKTKLTESQKFSNAKLDFEIAQSEREFQHRLKMDALMGRITVVGRKAVFGIRYVE